MPHWTKNIIDIFEADTLDLRELAIIAGGDPATFYQYTNIDTLDIRGQNLRGMTFSNFDLSKMIYDADTVLPIPDIDNKTQEKAQAAAEALLKENKAVPYHIGVNVRFLYLANIEFSDMKLLSDCPYLTTLSVESDNVILNWKDLSNHHYMEILTLIGKAFVDLYPLMELSNLVRLHLFNTAVVDLSPIMELTKLIVFESFGTPVVDLTPLINLTELRFLNVKGSQVKDLTPLANLKKLRTLQCDAPFISDLSPLMGLKKLEYLSFNGSLVNSLAPLVELKDLESISLSATDVTDLTPLANLKKIHKVYFIRTGVTDLTPLKDLPPNASVSCEATQVTDWSPLNHVDDVRGRPDDWPRKAKQS